MTKNLGIALSALALLVMSTGAAVAGTKWQTNIVPESDTDPTLYEKSKISFSDKGKVKATIQGITDNAGMIVTTDTSIKNHTITGDEYFVILEGFFPGVSNIAFQFNLPFEVKEGKGRAKFDATGLFGLIPGGAHRASAMTSVKVVGPLGVANIDDCQTNLLAGGLAVGNNGGFVVDLGGGFVNPCDFGDLIGVGGVLIPILP